MFPQIEHVERDPGHGDGKGQLFLHRPLFAGQLDQLPLGGVLFLDHPLLLPAADDLFCLLQFGLDLVEQGPRVQVLRPEVEQFAALDLVGQLREPVHVAEHQEVALQDGQRPGEPRPALFGVRAGGTPLFEGVGDADFEVQQRGAVEVGDQSQLEILLLEMGPAARLGIGEVHLVLRAAHAGEAVAAAQPAAGRESGRRRPAGPAAATGARAGTFARRRRPGDWNWTSGPWAFLATCRGSFWRLGAPSGSLA